ncbi:unnamed protein product [Camellia sinensis]
MKFSKFTLTTALRVRILCGCFCGGSKQRRSSLLQNWNRYQTSLIHFNLYIRMLTVFQTNTRIIDCTCHRKHIEDGFGDTVAMKIVSKDKIIKSKMIDRVKREISIMKKVHRSNVVKLHEVMAIKSKIYFAMVYLCDGELFEKVSQDRLKEDSTWNFFKQLVCAVDFCHSHGIYHRDLKPEKLLLDKNGNLK